MTSNKTGSRELFFSDKVKDPVYTGLYARVGMYKYTHTHLNKYFSDTDSRNLTIDPKTLTTMPDNS
jgi:hypothetical protein